MKNIALQIKLEYSQKYFIMKKMNIKLNDPIKNRKFLYMNYIY